MTSRLVVIDTVVGLLPARSVEYAGATYHGVRHQEHLLKPILVCALERCQREGIHMLEAVGFSSEKQSLIENLASHRRELSAWRYFYKADEPYLAASLAHPQAWDPTCYDGDCSL